MKLSLASLDWALKHIELEGDTNVFPRPFEYLAIRQCWDAFPGDPGKHAKPGLRDYLAAQEMLSWNTRPYRKSLSPKHRFGFRSSTQLDPFDAIVFSALIKDVGSELEARRQPLNKRVVHSNRFMPHADGRMYDPSVNYETFTQRSAELAVNGKYKRVVIADIADFYPRIYIHPIETTLGAAIQSKDHVNCLIKLIKQWNYRISFGIPVGPAASALIAEAAISDVDDALVSEQLTYCRFSDDYRIFCEDEISAYKALAFLANTLFENHGLTLQQHKTEIVNIEVFKKKYLQSERKIEKLSLKDKFAKILTDLSLSDPYQTIEYDDLPEPLQKEIDGLNLKGILETLVTSPAELDIGLTRFLLRRLAQVDDKSAINLIFTNIAKFYPVFKEAIEYLQKIRKISTTMRHEVGKKLLDLLESSAIGNLDYHKCWILNTFAKDREWDNQDTFVALYNSLDDEFSRRELTAALGRSGQTHWFKSRKRNVSSLGPWERRAFLAAASCLPGDEGEYWYKSIWSRLDELEKAVVVWAKANPFG